MNENCRYSTANAFYGEARGVMINADAHPPEIASHVVHAGNRSAQLRDHEVVYQHAFRVPSGTCSRPPFASTSPPPCLSPRGHHEISRAGTGVSWLLKQVVERLRYISAAVTAIT